LFAIKILVPSPAAGSIIGKGGSTIAEMKESTGCRIHLSNNNDFFPGTQDRVVIVAGEVEAVKTATALILTKVHENNLSFSKRGRGRDSDDEGPTDSEMSTSLALSSPSSGAVIGKGGSTLKGIVNETRTRIQLSQRNEAADFPSERLCHFKGKLDGIIAAVGKVIDAVSEDNLGNRYENNSPNYNDHRNIDRFDRDDRGRSDRDDRGDRHDRGDRGGSRSSYEYRVRPSFSETPPVKAVENPYLNALSMIYGADANALAAALTNSQRGGAPQVNFGDTSNYGSAQGRGPPHGLGDYGGSMQEPSSKSYSGFGSARDSRDGPRSDVLASLPIADGFETTVTMQVPHEQVGALIGRGGSVIANINRTSGASVQISPKGEFAPGTENRVVTISGDNRFVQQAQLMVNSVLKEAQQLFQSRDNYGGGRNRSNDHY